MKKNIVMQVCDRYKNNYSMDTIRSCADFDTNTVIEPETASIGYLAEPAMQGANYQIIDDRYCYIPSQRAVENDPSYSIRNDEYADAFRRATNRNLLKTEYPVYIGINGYPRLVVLNAKDYQLWANNKTPIVPTDSFMVEMARINPYRIIIEEDGIHAHLVPNPMSTTTAICSNCGRVGVIENG